MLNKAQQVFIILWLLFAIYALIDGLHSIFIKDQLAEGLMYIGASVFAYLMHRVRKKQYSNSDK